MKNRKLMRRLGLIAAAALATVPPAQAQHPSFDCARAVGDIEALVCANAELAALDRQLSRVYDAATRRALNEQPPVLRAEQRGWIKGRNDCWKSADPMACVTQSYQWRIAELQARYRLVPVLSSMRLMCDSDLRNEIQVEFFQTEPESLIAERGDSMSLMFQQASDTGKRYQGRNESLWQQPDAVIVVWGFGATPMRCQARGGGVPSTRAR